MSKEEIQQLLEELESLRKENLDLKITVGLPSPEIINGYPAPAEIKEDVILKGLRAQIQTLQESNRNLKLALEGYEEAERSLSTLLPALEVQLKGQTTEIYNLKQNIDQTENTFAGVVRKLEQQLKQARMQWQGEKEQLRKEIFRLQIQSPEEKKSQNIPEVKPQKETENPFTDLSIFEI